MVSGIYKIEHIASGRCYVGSAICLKKRWAAHRGQLKAGDHHNKPLLNAWNKYGRAAFIFKTLERCPKDVLLQREQHWLDEIRPFGRRGYNICRVAGSVLGRKHTEATKHRLSKAHKGRKIVWRDKIAETMNAPAMKAELREHGFKRKYTEATKKKMSESARKRWGDPEQRESARLKSIGNENRKGKATSEDAKRRMSEAHRGKHVSEEQSVE